MIYVSTSCLKREKSVKKVLQEYAKVGIKNIELGSSHSYEPEIEKFLANYQKENSTKFIIHSYFPVPEQGFVMNLASQNPEILKRSLDQAKKSIRLCNFLSSELYTLNSGLRVDPDPNTLGKGLSFNEIADYDEAFQTFAYSINELCDYASNFRIKIALENHEASKKNLINNENKLLLMTRQEEFLKIISQIQKPNLGVLVDLGHLNVSSNYLNFNKEDFIRSLKEKIYAIHLHDNDGSADQHNPVNENSWGLQILKENLFNNIPIVIESVHENIEDILKTKKIIESVLK
tara:strand:- start:19995 stop:20864 length:870 start_codon:yes stop_codon:yes gene_type:complete